MVQRRLMGLIRISLQTIISRDTIPMVQVNNSESHALFTVPELTRSRCKMHHARGAPFAFKQDAVAWGAEQIDQSCHRKSDAVLQGIFQRSNA